MPTFAHWFKGKIAKKQQNELKNGVLRLKGGDLSEELKDFVKSTIYDLSYFYETKKIVHLPIKFKG